jgi:hypothetical protein
MRIVRGVATALVAAALAACGTEVSDGAEIVTPAGSGAPGASDPAQLVSTWTVVTPPSDAGANLLIGNRVDAGLGLFLSCGLMSGEWRANAHGMFIASEDGGDGDCFSNQSDPWPRWLDATAFRSDGVGDLLLLDPSGAILARLQPGGHPTTGPNDSGEFASPPVVSPTMRDSFKEPEPLPDGVSPASASDVLGRWLPLPGDRPGGSDRAYVTFEADGRYSGSDGCNGTGGRYVMGADGLILATSGGSTLIGCENSPLSSWPSESGRVGLRDGHLIFVDPDGHILGEAVRA